MTRQFLRYPGEVFSRETIVLAELGLPIWAIKPEHRLRSISHHMRRPVVVWVDDDPQAENGQYGGHCIRNQSSLGFRERVLGRGVDRRFTAEFGKESTVSGYVKSAGSRLDWNQRY